MTDNQQNIDRRRLFAGAGAVGALAVVAAVVPGHVPTASADRAEAKPAPDTDGGYRLTAHVKQYYETAKI
jgi:hypothetical protein